VLTEELYLVCESKKSAAILLEESDVTDLEGGGGGETCMIEEHIQ